MFDCGGYKSQYMDGQRETFVRLDDLDPRMSVSSDTGATRCGFNIKGTGSSSKTPSKSFRRGMRKGTEGLRSLGRAFQFVVPRAVFPEDVKECFLFMSCDQNCNEGNYGTRQMNLGGSVGTSSLNDWSSSKSWCFSVIQGTLSESSGGKLVSRSKSERIIRIIGCDYHMEVSSQFKSTLGQGLQTSTYPGEVIFSILLAILGLILFALLIGNMQTYLQSLTIRLEEMRVKRRDSEQWMHHRLLPQDLRERVRRYDQYKWLETRGVDEESLVQSLPKDLRRDIKRHLCLNLVRRVPLFENMDERLLDAICERLKPSLYTENTFIVREGDPVDEMLFIIRGRLESVTTDGGRSGFFNRSLLKEGDFCGEELLTWALDPKSGANLPSSTRTVKALNEVEAFALIAEELKFVASQFRRLHSRQVQHTFRFYSQQWRTWAACFIQAAWRRYCKRKAAELRRREEEMEAADGGVMASSSLGATLLVSRFAANALRGVHRFRDSKGSVELVKLPMKPSEPDFSIDDEAD
ncbi:putative cyclic nucleotide-gated ion channel 9 [Acorus gramineus]|uniref:Cyclic nucleotide-gated ion channel 9 n=1 Tax=Acorus gramineus TaxID=55184 RepID=A0AAV9B9D2_ACOGR|nr:putative cyclic nucleotide-gated ion channel 9 [Acorus gramineus]